LWGYTPINQWIANRGYVCIEIDYRGSGGYGKAFLNASAQEWAGKMHDDLIDGLEHAIAQGWIDRDRMAIFGGSYGGYAALVGATFTPDVFKCAIDYVGPSNLITLLKSIPPYWFAIAKQFEKLLGDPDKDRDHLWERSPLSRVDQIKIPMLIAQGANDPRVKQAESEQIVDAMKERGIDHEYLLFSDEGHGFMRPENRETFHLACERFLAKHLGGRAQDL
jgi:dipeptidyl aminopeptidase/acylaminoacyl peptidase